MSYSIITVNAGHSAKASGASGNGYKEHEVARQIKDKLIKALNLIGQKTVDTTSDASSPNAVLKEQVFKCNSVSKANRLDVSIHLNAGGGTGTEVLFLTAEELATKVSTGICSATGYKNRGAKKRTNLYFLNNTNAPAIIIEVCFIDNDDDVKILMDKMDDIVNAIVKSLTGKEVERVETKKDDVKGHWAEKSINKAKKAKVMNGYSDGSFKPNNPLTRAEMATILDNIGMLDK